MNPIIYQLYNKSKIFESTWKTDNISTGSSTSTQVKLPLVSTGSYSFNVDWGDGSYNTITTYNQAAVVHTYASAGTYTIKIKGKCTGWVFNNTGDKYKILSIKTWGGLKLGTSEGAYFLDCKNLDLSIVEDILDLSGTTHLDSGFSKCTSLTTINRVEEWNTGSIVVVQNLFLGCTNFNQPLNSWNTSEIVILNGMFSGCSNFNQPLNSWNTSKVTAMSNVFNSCSKFNQSLNTWDTSKVNNMYAMFSNCAIFNNGLAAGVGGEMTWVTSLVTTFEYMFYVCDNFNQALNSWDTSKAINMSNTFFHTSLFNNGLAPGVSGVMTWVTSLVTNFSGMFYYTISFNQILNWDTTKAINMANMFGYSKFNNGLAPGVGGTMSFNTSLVTNISGMFSYTTNFNQEIGNWDVSKVTDMSYLFHNSNFNRNLNAWNTSKVIDMSYSFRIASKFNNGLAPGVGGDMTWDLSSVTNFSNAFQSASSFNQNVNSWNPIKATNMNYIFDSAILFNNGLASGIGGTMSWNTVSAVTMEGIFRTAAAFNQNLNSWDVSKVTNMYMTLYSMAKFNNGLAPGEIGVMTWNTDLVSDMRNMIDNSLSFNQDIGSWNISNVINFNSFMNSKTPSTYSTSNLDSIYNGWSSRPVKPSISISFGTAKRTSASTTSRAILTGAPNNWSILDGGI